MKTELTSLVSQTDVNLDRVIQHRPLGFWLTEVLDWLRQMDDDIKLRPFRLAKAREPYGVKVQDWDLAFWSEVRKLMLTVLSSTEPDLPFLLSRILFFSDRTTRLFDGQSLTRFICMQAGESAFDTVARANYLLEASSDVNQRPAVETPTVQAGETEPTDPSEPATPIGAGSVGTSLDSRTPGQPVDARGSDAEMCELSSPDSEPESSEAPLPVPDHQHAVGPPGFQPADPTGEQGVPRRKPTPKPDGGQPVGTGPAIGTRPAKTTGKPKTTGKRRQRTKRAD